MNNTEFIKELTSLYEELKNNRTKWVSTWKALAEQFDSTGYREDYEYTEDRKANDVINKNIIDNTGVEAAGTLASGMQGGMTSPARPWFALRRQGFYAAAHDVEKYLDDVVERIRVIYSISNFYNVMYQVYDQLGIFGIACLFEEASLEGFSFTCLPVGTYVVDVDSKGKVDTVIRKMWLSWKQIAKEFGEEVIPEEIRNKRSNSKMWFTDKQEVFHAVVPNSKENIVKNSINPKQKAYKSIYYMAKKDKGENIVLRESGYDSMPFFVVRWSVQAGDIYGKSPALNVLGNVMLLQKVVEDTAEGIHKQVNPPVNAPASLKSAGVDLSAGAVNFYQPSVQGNATISALQVGTNVDAARMYAAEIRNAIKVGMYNDLFRMLLDSNRRQITALEVASKEEEKLILIGPVLERLQHELFNPLITRTIELMQRYNLLPPAPPSMQGQQIKVEFVSTLAQAQKIVATGVIQQIVAFIGNLAQMKPEALDLIDVDVVVRKYAEHLGVEASILLSLEEVQKIRAQRAKAQETQMAQAQMAHMAQTVKTMGDTPVHVEGSPNALDAVLGGLGGL